MNRIRQRVREVDVQRGRSRFATRHDASQGFQVIARRGRLGATRSARRRGSGPLWRMWLEADRSRLHNASGRSKPDRLCGLARRWIYGSGSFRSPCSNACRSWPRLLHSVGCMGKRRKREAEAAGRRRQTAIAIAERTKALAENGLVFVFPSADRNLFCLSD